MEPNLLKKITLGVSALTISALLLSSCAPVETTVPTTPDPFSTRSPTLALTITPGASAEAIKIPEQNDLIKIQTSKTVLQVRKEDMQKMEAIPAFGGLNFLPLAVPLDQQAFMSQFGNFLKENKDAILTWSAAAGSGALKVAGVALPIVGEAAGVTLLGAASSYAGTIQGMTEGPIITRPIMDTNGKIIGFEDFDRMAQVTVRTYDAVADEKAAAKSVGQLREKLDANFMHTPDGWKPPDKDYCGENMVRYFATFFYDETLGDISIQLFHQHGQAGFDIMDKAPVHKLYPTAKQERAETEQRLQQKISGGKCEKYSGDSSLFMAYKRMRNQFYKKIEKMTPNQLAQLGKKLGVELTRQPSQYSYDLLSKLFSPNMPADQAYSLVLKIVAEWW